MSAALSSASTASPRAFNLALRLELQAIALFELPYVNAIVFEFTLFTFHNHSLSWIVPMISKSGQS